MLRLETNSVLAAASITNNCHIQSPSKLQYTMNTIREIAKINEQELERGIAGTPASWHAQYANSAWCYVGNLDHELTEGDVLVRLKCVVLKWWTFC